MFRGGVPIFLLPRKYFQDSKSIFRYPLVMSMPKRVPFILTCTYFILIGCKSLNHIHKIVVNKCVNIIFERKSLAGKGWRYIIRVHKV